MDITVRTLDPEWTSWAKCPEMACKVVTHACCPEHVREAMNEHTAIDH